MSAASPPGAPGRGSGYLRPATPAEGIRTALELFDLAVDMLRTRLRRERPGISEEELAEAVRAWMCTRPGAEHGDGEGRVSTRFDPR